MEGSVATRLRAFVDRAATRWLRISDGVLDYWNRFSREDGGGVVLREASDYLRDTRRVLDVYLYAVAVLVATTGLAVSLWDITLLAGVAAYSGDS